MSGFDDYIKRANIETQPPEVTPAPLGERSRVERWEYTHVDSDAKYRAKDLQRMANEGWEYVEKVNRPLLSWGRPHRLVFRRWR